MSKQTTLVSRLRALAEREFPENAIHQDPQTLSYGKENDEFLQRCQVDLHLSELDGFGSYVYHLTAEAYAVLIPRTLLKYLTLMSGSRDDISEALFSGTLATFLGPFDANPESAFLTNAMKAFERSDISVLRESAAAIIEMEKRKFDRDISYLDEVEGLIAWIDTNCAD